MRSGISVTAAPERSAIGWPVAAALAMAAVAIAAGGWSGATSGDQAVLIARYSARVSLGLFVIVYVMAALRDRRSPPGAYRRWLAAFVAAHLIHFATMLHLIGALKEKPGAPIVVFGILAYAVPFAVAAWPGDPRAGWRRAALDYVWLSFAVTYYHRLFEFPDRREAGAFAFALLLTALTIRIVAAARRRW